ncbi:response regulator [Brevibacillus humidisoli]|uniref:response regulator n=1 Tax=Brevibacillus humidisoli TaxID=2895522 RepID=UPI001E3EBCAD|nr:response regulator [Brevibacillus humidisoli]UFJ38871.1 response regulator [Brevibacillus humidisoli]
MKILIIDDDAAIRYMLSEICSYAGWKAFTCANGKEGVGRFVQDSADVVLVDYHMPEMDGLQTVREIRKLDRQVPILVLTVDERQEIADRFLDEGATDFALKPVKAPDLISRIQLHKRLIELTSNQRAAKKPEEEVFVTKGISKITLSHIVKYLSSQRQPCLIDEISKEVNLAYPTVYRYLVYLMKMGKVRAIVSYQKVGRPKNRYQWIQE